MRTLLPVVVLSIAGCSAANTEETSLFRGDLAFAQGDFEEALAEYRLAVAQGADDAETLARVAHAYAMMDRVDDAGAYYVEATAKDTTFTDQAVSDLMWLARGAREREDRFAMASAAETAFRLRPGLGVADMSLDLARHYFRNGEYGRALPFYEKVLGEAADSAPEVVFEVAQAHEEIGDCAHALLFFERFREMVRAWERGEVDWYIGTCAFSLAMEIRAGRNRGERQLNAALSHLDRVLEVGEPRNLQAQAWFEKGRILSDVGDCTGAMEAFSQVRYSDNAGSLVNRAQSLFDEIRFGRGLEPLRDGRCR
jgi:tetratricopeptide (TPR) repeat protein